MSARWVLARDPREGELDEPSEDRYTEEPTPDDLPPDDSTYADAGPCFDVAPFPLPPSEAPAMPALPDCSECDDTLLIDVTYNSDPTDSHSMVCDKCQAGRDLARELFERDNDDGA